jgi:thiol-disulfide isomerase/thioredoxin
VVAAAVVAVWAACSLQQETTPVKGTPAPSMQITLKDMTGRDVTLASYTGRPVLLNFWATWCPPCKAEIPWFVALQSEYKDKLAVLGVSVDDTPEDIRTFSTEYKINYPLLVGDKHDDFKKAFDADDVIPVSWLIRADGTVQTKVQGIHPQDWFEAQVKTLVSNEIHD